MGRGKFWFGAQRRARVAEVGDLKVRDSDAAPTPEWSSRADKAPLAEEQAGEIAEFLARVYTHQQC